MGRSVFIMHGESEVDEGTAFPALNGQVTYLNRFPPYLLEPTQYPLGTVIGNTTLVYNDQYGGGYNLTILENLEQYHTLCTTGGGTSDGSMIPTVAGYNQVIFTTPVNVNEWGYLWLHYGWMTTGINTTGFKLIFADGTRRTIKNALENGYISPLCLLTGYKNYSDPNWMTLYTDGNLSTRNYPMNNIFCKPLLVSLVGVEFTSNRGSYPYYDGFRAEKYSSDIKFSYKPIGDKIRIRNKVKVKDSSNYKDGKNMKLKRESGWDSLNT